MVGAIDDALVDHVRAEHPESLVRLGHEFEVLDDRLAVGGRRAEVTTSRGSRFEVLVPLHGAHQSANAAIAIEAAESVLHGQLDQDLIESAFEGLRVPGRIEMVQREPVVILDGAHNPDAAAALGRTLAEAFIVAGRRVAVVGMLAGRSPGAFLEALDRAFPLDLVVACPLPGPRGVPAAEIAAAAEALGLAVGVADSMASGVTRTLDASAEEDLVLVTGSFRVVSDARDAVRRH